MTADMTALPPQVTFLERGVLHSNSCVLHGPQGFLLVDTGYCTGVNELILAIEQQARRPLHELELIVNTHAHPDHTGGNAELRARTGCEIVMSDLDRMLVESGDPVTLMRGWADLECPSFEVTRALAPGERLRFGEHELLVVEGAGHAAGEVSYFCAEAGYLLCGDLLWQAGFSNVVPLVEGLGGLARHERSLAALRALPIEVAVPGHGPLILGAAAIRERIDETIATIRFFRANQGQWARSNLKAFLTMHALVRGPMRRADFAARCRRAPWFREQTARFFPDLGAEAAGALVETLLDELLARRLLELRGEELCCALRA
jgi:glyoxylase-like metal-dependent hydrolase (beta-lactamase superfamily II)